MRMIWDTLANFPPEQLLTFMVGALLLNFAPGQDVFFASACGIQNGPRDGAMAGLGVGLGGLFHVCLATAGLGALVATHPQAMVAIKYMGAAYLLLLAWKSWHASIPASGLPVTHSKWNIIRRGAVSNVLNPKPVLFLLAFLPQFTRPDYGPVWQQILALGLMFVCSGTLVTMGYGVVAGYAGKVVGPRLRILNRIAAVMFAGLALRLVRS